MNGRKYQLHRTALILTLLLINSPVSAGEDNVVRFTLQGIEAVYVRVERIDPELGKELKKSGLHEDLLETAIERKLEAAGIKVIEYETFQNSEQKHLLNIKVEILLPEATQKFGYIPDGTQVHKTATVRYFYTVRAELRQMVSLVRNPGIKALSATWTDSSLGLRRLSRIKTDVMDRVDAFILDFKAANPG